MIHTSRQLKDLVRNRSGGDSLKAQVIIRNYMTERFLERLSLSKYRENLVLKGGVLVAAVIGLDLRSTFDMDATVKNLPLSETDAMQIVEDIISVPLDDGMSFNVKSISPIMGEADYPGLRVMLDATLENMHTPLKIDFSAGDVITPREIDYSFRLLFEDRTISILAYNLETILAEKFEAVITRGTTNTRMRDFYDICVIGNMQARNIDNGIFKKAYINTSDKRGSAGLRKDMDLIFKEITESTVLMELWKNYQNKYEYAANLTWDEVMQAVRQLADKLK